jgi:hypothetical protein
MDRLTLVSNAMDEMGFSPRRRVNAKQRAGPWGNTEKNQPTFSRNGQDEQDNISLFLFLLFIPANALYTFLSPFFSARSVSFIVKA